MESLAKAVNEDKDNWVEMLQPKVFAYNTSIQASTGYTPFELLHTFTPRLPVDVELLEPPATMKQKDWAESMQRKAEIMRDDALKNQIAAATRQKEQFDRGLEPVQFEVGDLVRVYDPTAEGSKPKKFRNQWELTEYAKRRAYYMN